jgi:H+-translocating NAD(P) transhydrogenase
LHHRFETFDPEEKFPPGSLSGLSSQATARQGNVLGILGVSSGILASLAAVGFPPEVLAQFAAVATIGGTVGTIIGRRITATELPQMVAALHSVVGLAAVLTSIGSVIGTAADHISTLHLVTAYLGVLIGESYLFSLTGPASGLFTDAVTVKVG